jgi:DNA-binding cell septation regulator SpoVG
LEVGAQWTAEQQGQANLEVTARPIEPKGNLYGFANVKIGGVTVDDFKIVADKDGKLYVGMPSKPEYINKDIRDSFSAAVIEGYHVAIQKAQDRDLSPKAAPVRPRLVEQVKEAAKEALRRNAELPAKEKGNKKREATRD